MVTMGSYLLLPAVIKATIGNESAWNVVLAFCEDIMSWKEAVKRKREHSSVPIIRHQEQGARSILTGTYTLRLLEISHTLNGLCGMREKIGRERRGKHKTSPR